MFGSDAPITLSPEAIATAQAIPDLPLGLRTHLADLATGGSAGLSGDDVVLLVDHATNAMQMSGWGESQGDGDDIPVETLRLEDLLDELGQDPPGPLARLFAALRRRG